MMRFLMNTLTDIGFTLLNSHRDGHVFSLQGMFFVIVNGGVFCVAPEH